MKYVIELLDDRFRGVRYVAPPGLPRSYTRNILEARRFGTREAAEAECCGNERVVKAPIYR